ncbi:hypothetical protein SAMN05421507_102686 [Lentzea jiangxiensis]|uniref:Uncharacterized protein n=1 Tax=Lentzea jiangxiensis TaxID=641025 RepID=A0A1H0JY59_9PSEU|nr:hypothetical protein SAMN05421507_102686 [Lentzea jiangxiensis]
MRVRPGERNQGLGHVAVEGEGVRHVQVPGDPRGTALLQRRLDQHGVDANRVLADVVGAADLGSADAGTEGLFPHPFAQATFAPGGGHGGVLVHPAIGLRSIGVETAGERQDRVIGLRGGDHRGSQGWRQALPQGVRGRVRAVVDRFRTAGQLGHPQRVGGVRGYPLDQWVRRAGAAARDDPDAVAALDQQAGDVRADGAGTDDDMFGHDELLLGVPGSRPKPVQAGTPTRVPATRNANDVRFPNLIS